MAGQDVTHGSPEPGEAGLRDAHVPVGRPGPGWRVWALTILAAVILSVTATLLLGGSRAGRVTPPAASETVAGGCGDPCCPPAAPGR